MEMEMMFTCGGELQIFYFIGFGFFCLESVLSIWVIQVFIILWLQLGIALKLLEILFVWLFDLIFALQQVYMYFRGSGKAEVLKRDAARGTMMAAL